MIDFLNNRADVVRYVNEKLPHSEPDLPWTMTITVGKYVEFFAHIVTDGSSDATEQDLAVLSFLPTQVNT